MKTITQDIKAHRFKPVYLLSGEESYLTRQFCKKLQDAILGDDEMNLTRFQDKDPDINEIISIADTAPFFAEARLLIIENSGYLKKNAGELPDYLDHLPEETHIIFVEDEIDKRNRLYQKIKKIGYCAEFNKQTPDSLTVWAAGILKQNGIRITRSTMEYFLENTGEDMNLISNELDKLISYLGDRTILEKEDIDALCTRRLQDKIFEMIEAMSNHDRQKAFSLYLDLVALREAPIKILVLITRQYLQLYQVGEMKHYGLAPDEIAKTAGIHPYVAKKMYYQVDHMDAGRIRYCIDQCAEMDESIKTGKIKDNMAVELLITDFSM